MTAQSWRLEGLDNRVIEIGTKVEDIATRFVRHEAETDVRAEILVNDVGMMLADQSDDIVGRMKGEVTDDVVARVSRRLANDSAFADKIASAVVARQNAQDPAFFAKPVQTVLGPRQMTTSRWSSGSSLYTLPMSPNSPTSPSYTCK